jgi:hypothetical protein
MKSALVQKASFLATSSSFDNGVKLWCGCQFNDALCDTHDLSVERSFKRRLSSSTLGGLTKTAKVPEGI